MESLIFKDQDNASYNFLKAKDFFPFKICNPTTLTNSVLGIKFDGGVALAADCGVSSGSVIKFTDVQRMRKINDWVVMAADESYGDYQFIADIIENRSVNDEMFDDGFHMTGKTLHSWLTRYMYAKRSQLDPLWTTVVIAGYEKGQCFLGTVDKLGLAYEDNCVATGKGAYLALPLIRHAVESNKTIELQEAMDVLMKGMEVLFYRDKSAIQQVEFAVVEETGVHIFICDEISNNWEAATNIRGYN